MRRSATTTPTPPWTTAPVPISAASVPTTVRAAWDAPTAPPATMRTPRLTMGPAYPPVGGICDCFTDLSITETLSGGAAGTPATFTGTGESAPSTLRSYTTAQEAGPPTCWWSSPLRPASASNSAGSPPPSPPAVPTSATTWPGTGLLVTPPYGHGRPQRSRLSGDGGCVQLINGYSSGAGVTYVADIRDDVCIGGVIDGAAGERNYDADATVDDGSWPTSTCAESAEDNSTWGAPTAPPATSTRPPSSTMAPASPDQCGVCGGDDALRGGDGCPGRHPR